MLSTAPCCCIRTLGKTSPSTNGFKPRPKTQIQFLPNKPSPITYPPVPVPTPSPQSPTQTVLQHIDTCLSLLSDPKHGGGEWRKEKVADVVGSGAEQIHAQILKLGLVVNSGVGNKLVVLYLEVGMEESAVNLFDEIPTRQVPVYAALVGYYGGLSQWEDVISVFVSMVEDGFRPDRFLLPKIIKACSELEDLTMGVSVHGYVLKAMELSVDVFVGNSLIDMYARCRDLNSSIEVFDNMPQKDVISWTALITAHSNAGLMDDASRIFDSMQVHGVTPDLICWNALLSGFARNGCVDVALDLLEGMNQNGPNPGINSWNGVISGCVQNGLSGDALNLFRYMLDGNIQAPDSITVASILPACSDLKQLSLGKELHAYAIKHGFTANAYVGGSVIDMYFKCGKSELAEIVFSNLKSSKKTSTVWNEMIAAYTNQGRMSMVSELLQLMTKDGGSRPDVITYNTILAAHARNGSKDAAFAQFYAMARMGLKPNTVSLNSLIAGFQQRGLNIEALELVRIMQLAVDHSNYEPHPRSIFPDNILNTVIHPNAVTITSALSACADLKLKNQGREIHGYILRNSLESNVFVSSTLVDMYSKCVDIASATKAFRQISDTSTVTWNILMSGFNYNGKPESALKLFPEMLEQGVSPSLVTMVILLSTCSAICALSLGRGLHSYIAKNIMVDEESSIATVTVQTTLINMYAKCGSVVDARMVFEYSNSKDSGLWNAMISCYSLHGMAADALYLFDKMGELGIKSDHITFTAILSVCNQQGLVEAGRRFFNSMEGVYGISPTLEHFTCMVGVLGDAGLIEEALELVRNMPFEPDSCVWATLLRSCRIHSNHAIGEMAAGKLFKSEPTNTSNYITLSNIYAMAGMWEASRDVWIAMRGRGLKIAMACSRINVGNTIHVFKAGEKRHPGLRKILETCDELSYEMERTTGFVPQEVIFDDNVVDEIDPFGCFHTEKLAICYGVISMHAAHMPNMPIRVSKSARMCIDCHTWSKFVSKIEGREVFVRDGCFYHHFVDGVCSCKDKW